MGGSVWRSGIVVLCEDTATLLNPLVKLLNGVGVGCMMCWGKRTDPCSAGRIDGSFRSISSSIGNIKSLDREMPSGRYVKAVEVIAGAGLSV